MDGPAKENVDLALSAWNDLPRALRLTKKRPQKPGFYWYEEDHEKQPVHVFKGATLQGEEILCARFFGEGDIVHRVNKMTGKWAGPMREPA